MKNHSKLLLGKEVSLLLFSGKSLVAEEREISRNLQDIQTLTTWTGKEIWKFRKPVEPAEVKLRLVHKINPELTRRTTERCRSSILLPKMAATSSESLEGAKPSRESDLKRTSSAPQPKCVARGPKSLGLGPQRASFASEHSIWRLLQPAKEEFAKLSCAPYF